MPRIKSPAKEPVKLREKKLAGGNVSLYLDYCHDGRREREFLRLYLIPGNSPAVRSANANTMAAARAIKAQRIIDITARRAGLRVPARRLPLRDWINSVIESKRHKASASLLSLYALMRDRVEEFRPGASLADVDKEFCTGFIEFLRTARPARGGRKSLGANTRRVYFMYFSTALNEAVRAGLIDSNPVARLSASERIRPEKGSREFLTGDELRRLIATPVEPRDRPDISAFLFCCFCGLRHSDVGRLTWGDICSSASGEPQIRLLQKKTASEVVIPLSRNARRFLPPRAGAPDTARIFRLSSLSTAENRLRRWVEAAGIAKHVTFHVSRHTFATMMLTAGADLYTTSKLLGHADIQTTQIYARIVDRKKEEAVSMLDSHFS